MWAYALTGGGQMAEHRIETAIDIETPAERVWALLTDFVEMPSWNPFITSISGALAQGARLSVQVAPPGKSVIRFKPIILSVRPEREIRWLGTLFVKGVFDGEHYFLLEPIGKDRTRLVNGEKFSGLLAGPLSSMLPATEQGFQAMNAALKRQAEQSERSDSQIIKGAKKWWQSKGIIGGLGTMAVGGVTLLTSTNGLTLYWFAPDTSTTSKCTGSCATYWPPLKGPVSAGSGVSGTLGVITRPDGTMQATYDGHPLYTYAGDTSPGQNKGNGLNVSGGAWHEVTVSGAAPASGTTSSHGGYGY